MWLTPVMTMFMGKKPSQDCRQIARRSEAACPSCSRCNAITLCSHRHALTAHTAACCAHRLRMQPAQLCTGSSLWHLQIGFAVAVGDVDKQYEAQHEEPHCHTPQP